MDYSITLLGSDTLATEGFIPRVGQNHIYTVCKPHFWQGNDQIYGHIQCIYTVLDSPIHTRGHLTTSGEERVDNQPQKSLNSYKLVLYVIPALRVYPHVYYKKLAHAQKMHAHWRCLSPAACDLVCVSHAAGCVPYHMQQGVCRITFRVCAICVYNFTVCLCVSLVRNFGDVCALQIVCKIINTK